MGRSPAWKSRLRLEALDERAVPSSTPVSPPDGPPGQTGDPSTPTPVTLADGAWLGLASVGDYDVYYTRSDDAGFLVVVNAATGDFSITRTDYSTPIDLSTATGVQAGFTPNATLPSAVWDPNTGTYATVPAGTAFGTVGGYVTNGWNMVVLPLAPGFDPTAERVFAAGAVSLGRAAATAADPPGRTSTVKIIGPDGSQVGPTLVLGPSNQFTPPPGANVQVDPNGNTTVTLPPPAGSPLPQVKPPPSKPELAPMPRPVPPSPAGVLPLLGGTQSQQEGDMETMDKRITPR